MPGKPTTPYHIAEQYAEALLRPVAATLTDLDARLAQYAERLYLGDDDRARIEQARAIVAEARMKLQSVIDVGDGRSTDGVTT